MSRRILKYEKAEILRDGLELLRHCRVIPFSFAILERATDLIKKYDFQIFDSIMVASALQAGCTVLYTEDMHHGLVIEKQLQIINPFL